MTKQQPVKLDRATVSIRLGACAAALGGAAATAPDARAQVVTFNTPISVPANIDGVYINFQTGATGTTAASVAGWDFNPYAATTPSQLQFFWNNSTANTSGGVATASPGTYLDLPAGTVVGSSSAFANNVAGTAGSPFLTTGTHTLGFRFLNESTNTVNYGYLTMTNSAGTPAGFPTTITGWSFELSGGPITVAPVPEPATTLLTTSVLAAGACGLRRWRRQAAPLGAAA